MASPASRVEEQLRQLRDSFTTRLPSRVVEIDRAWDAVLQNAWNQETTRQFHRLTHGLAGSAASFGHTELSQSARQLELFVQTLIERGKPPTKDQIATIAARLNALKELAVPSRSAAAFLEGHITTPETVLPKRESDRLVFLVKDGEPSDQLATQIGYFDYRVRVVCGMDGLAKQLAQASPVAVLVDTDRLPIEMNSNWFSQIRKEEGDPIPVIFLSSRGDLASRLSAVRAGAHAYFIKPVNLSHLIDKLDLLTTHRASEPYRILIVEDEVWLAQYYSLTLQKAGMETRTVSDLNLVLQELRDWKPDLILMDVYMPYCTGLELAGVIRQQEDYVSIPIVYLSAETRIEKQLAAMSLGGDDFLTKPIQPDHLVSSVVARAQRSHALRSLIIRDSLTGLLNHTAIKGQLELQVARARRTNTMLAYAMLDLDCFKQVNDTYGHPTGDGVLKTLARLLQQRLRKTDVIGRYGGEEFAVILPGASGPSACKVLDEIRSGFAQIRQQSVNVEFSTTFSAGVAECPQFNDAIRLNDAADRALYQAKQNGRNNVMLAQAL